MLNLFSEYLSYTKLLKWIIRHPIAIITGIAAVTFFFAVNLPSLSVGTSVYDFVIDDLSETTHYQEFKKIFGSDEIIRVVIKAENIFDPIIFQKIEQMSEENALIKGVRRVISLPGIRKTVDVTDKWKLDEFAEILAPVELFRKNIISDDHKTTALTLILKDDAPMESVIQAVDEIISRAPGNISVYQIGMPLVSKALADFTSKDFFRLPPITFLVISVILFLLFQNLPSLVIPLLCVTTSLIWTFGLIALLKIPLSMLTMIVPIFLIAVGAAYCLYICAEYLAQTEHTESPADAVFSTFSNMALPTSLAVFTTVIGLGSLLVNRITAIHEFAIFSCFGILSLLIISLTLFPAALLLIPIPRKKGLFHSVPEKMPHLMDRFLDKIVNINLKHQGIALLIIGLAALFCGAGIFQLRSETNPVDYFKKDAMVSRHFHDIYQSLSGSFPINVVMESSTEDYFYDTPAHIENISSVQKFLETLPGVDKTISFADYIRLVNYAMNQFKPEYYAIPEESFELRMLINNYKTMLGDDMLSLFMSSDFSKVNILLLTHISSSHAFLETREKILGYASSQNKNLTWDVTGFGMVISASSQVLVMGQTKSFLLTLAIIFIIMFLLFLSFRVGIIAIIPCCFPIIINFGVMGWLGIKLSVATSLIASIAIGLAIDDIIHYLVRYNREFKKDLDKDRALRDTILHVGKPIIFTSLTISAGFFILIFSNFKPTAVFGFLMVVTMLSALAADMIVLPSLMLHVELVTAWDILRLMPTMEGISAGIAHELNQPLTVIKMGSDVLKMMMQQKGEIHEEYLAQVVNEISEQVDRASEMINRLRAFEGGTGFAKEKTDINKPVRDTLAIISHQLILDNIRLEIELADNLPPVLAHSHRLSQVVFNLINNAREAIEEAQKFREASEQNKRVIFIRTFQENDQAVMTVSDTGIGVPEHLKERIFEPFFTTKEKGKGKGLGLSITQEIVRNYNGNIQIQDNKERGTTFKVTFPVKPD